MSGTALPTDGRYSSSQATEPAVRGSRSSCYVASTLRVPVQVPLVARLGGFLARTGDGEPGVETIWLGTQRILDFAAGIRFSHELDAQEACL